MKEETKTLMRGIMTLVGCILLHLTFGIFYSVSNVAPYIISYMKANVDPTVELTSAIWLTAPSLGIQGITMPCGGFLSKRIGARIVIAISCVLCSGGVGFTYVTVQYSFAGVVCTYAVLFGGGLGIGYAVVLATAAAWFPARRGLIVGMIVGGFGLGALVFTPIQTAFINPSNVAIDKTSRLFLDAGVLRRVPSVFLLLGGILLTVQCIGMLLIRCKPTPPKEEEATTEKTPQPPPKPPRKLSSTRSSVEVIAGPKAKEGPVKSRAGGPTFKKSDSSIAVSAVEAKKSGALSVKEVLRCLDFYLLWTIMLCHIIPTTLITSASKMFGQQYIADDRYLAGVVMASSLCNCIGRIVWGAIVDRLSFKLPLCGMLIMWSGVLITFPHIALQTGVFLRVLYALWVCLLFTSISGVFSIMPAATSTLFGHANLAVNYGLVFTAFAVGSTISVLGNTYFKAKDIYYIQFTTCGFICLIALFLTLWVTDRKMPSKVNVCAILVRQCKPIRGHVGDVQN